MPTYEVLFDLAVPTGEQTYEGRSVTAIIEGGKGNTVELSESYAAPLVDLGILAVPGADEPTHRLRESAVEARERAVEARQTAAVAEDEAQAIQREMREDAASRLPEGRSI